MTKEEFFSKYGDRVIKAREGSSEKYGDFVFLHPERLDEVREYQDDEENYQVFSVHDTEDGFDFVDISIPCDTGTQPFKHGYFVIRKSLNDL
jgi:hypothetical protein